MTDYRAIRLYVPGPSEMQNVLEVCAYFDALYTAILWNPAVPVRVRPRPLDPGVLGYQTTDGLFGRSTSDTHGTKLQFRSLSDFTPSARQRLWLNSVTPVGSVEVNLTGVGEVIDKTGDLLDPTRRKARKQAIRHDDENHNENLRHQTRMNLIAEQEAADAADENRSQRLAAAFSRQLAVLTQLRDLGVITPQEFQAETRALLGLGQVVSTELETRGVEIIDIADDDVREISN